MTSEKQGSAPSGRRGGRLRLHWRNILPFLVVVVVFVGRRWYGLSYTGLWAAIALVGVHFLIMPRLAVRASKRLEQELLRSAQRKRPDEMAAAVRRAWLVRLYLSRWYVRGRQAWVAVEAGELAKAEQLYQHAVLEAGEPERSRFLANLVTVKRRLGKDEEADRIVRRLGATRPDLLAALSHDA